MEQRIGTERSALTLTTRLGYGIGDFAFNSAYQLVAFFLLIYYTDVFGIEPAQAGTIFLVAKIWDAVTDPVMGLVTDATRSRWGRKRPYLLFGAVPLGAAVFFLFAGPDIDTGYRFAYGLATFILFSTAITVTNIPYGSLTAALTTDSHERASLSGYRMTFALLGTLFAAGATKPLVSLFADEAAGYRYASLIIGALVVVILWITFYSVREHVAVGKEEPVDIKTGLRIIFTNGPFLILTGATLLLMVAVNLLAIIVNYYFKYNLHREGLVPVAFLCIFVTAAAIIPFFVKLSERTDKRPAFLIGLSLLVPALVALFFFGEGNLAITFTILFVAGAGISTVFLFPWAMIPDTVEVSQLKTGHRREGLLYGVYWMSYKIGTALAGFIAGIGLSSSGYVQNVAQTPSSLLGIRVLTSLVPCLFIVLGMLLISRYPISRAYHAGVLEQINGRKGTRAGGPNP